MKRLFSLFLVGILLMGCQDRLAYQKDGQDGTPVTKSEDLSGTFSINEPYTFLAEKDFKAWVDIVTLEDRLAACEVPESTLKAMTTEALVRTVLKYPLNFIYSAYNDPLVAVDIIVKNSPLHQELFSRSDAPQMLLRYFGRTNIDANFRNMLSNRSETCLAYANEMFFDYLLASRLFSGMFDRDQVKELQGSAQRKFEERLFDSEDFSEVSLAPLRMVLDGASSDSQTRSFYYWQWYTPFGEMLRAEARTEMTDSEINCITSYYTSNYQNAGMLAMASDRYNGNGYAWMINDPTAGSNNNATTSNSWLCNGDDSGNDFDDMWTDAFYDETSTESDAERVYYGAYEDHTAIPTNNQKYISKWGNGPLMKHALAYCPYSVSDTTCYRIRTTPTSTGFTIDGPASVVANVTNVYSFPASLRGITLSWSAEDISTGSTTSFSFNPATHSLCCYVTGAYKIHVEGYFGSNHVITKEKIIVCYP